MHDIRTSFFFVLFCFVLTSFPAKYFDIKVIEKIRTEHFLNKNVVILA